MDIEGTTKINFWMQGAAHVLVWCFVAFLIWTTPEAYFNYTIYRVETGKMQIMHDLLPDALARAGDDSERIQQLLDSGFTTMPLAILDDDGAVFAQSSYMHTASRAAHRKSKPPWIRACCFVTDTDAGPAADMPIVQWVFC